MNPINSLQKIREQYAEKQEITKDLRCPHCNGLVTIETTASFRTEACENKGCGKHWDLKPTGICCESPSFHAVKMIIAGGDIQVKEQCENCGHVKKNAVGGFDKAAREALPELNSMARERSRIKLSEFETDFNNKCRTRAFVSGQPEWRRKHGDYMKTAEWRYKRDLVLKRDKYLCQDCLTNPATQVHHKTYRNTDFTGMEPAFDLVSLCRPCHERVHGIS